MRRIKIKLPFKNKNLDYRHKQLIEMAHVLTNDNFFTIIEERHLNKMSYMIVLVENAFEYTQKVKKQTE